MRSLPNIPSGTDGTLTGLAGQGHRHESADKHVSGEATYVSDHVLPSNALHVYVAFSSISHGVLTRLDLSKVKSAAGVAEVLTLEDVPGHTDIGPIFAGDPLMINQGGTVSFHGQVLFAVAANTYDEARKAARLAEVDYRPLPPNVSIESGIEAQSYVRPAHTQQRGDARKAIDEAANRLQGELQIGGQEHMYLEGQASLCLPQEDGGVLVHCSTQNPSEIQKLVAEVLDISMNKVAVDTRRMGGGFGGKETHANQWACLAALMTHKTRRATHIRLARADDFLSTGKRHHFLSRYDVGFDESGLINGLEMNLYGGCGISPDLSDAIVDRAMFHSDNAYYLPAATIVGHRVKTNTVSNTAFRGFGGPQGMVAIENIIDQIARSVGKDPLDVRKLNFYSDNNERNTTHYGQKIEQHIVPMLVERLEENANYRERREQIKQFNQSSPILKKGLALVPVKFGISFTAQHLNQAGALVHVYTDGSVQVNHGGTEMGQGLYTKVAQVVAQEFQIGIENIQCTSTRTDKVPNTSPTAASSGSDLNGMAAVDAVRQIKARMITFACEHFSLSEQQVRFADNSVTCGEIKMSFAEFAQLAYMHRVGLSSTGFYRTPKIHYDRETAKGRPFFYFANAAAISEVLIDTLTGENKILRVDICEDVGQSLNPALDIGQIEGGFIQGMGWLTTEELVWSDDGKLMTINPAAYKIPAIGDTPAEFNVELLPDSPNVEATIYHSKAVGEPPLMLGISVWCAIRDAISSLSNYAHSPALDAPATPERILSACDKIREQL